MRWRWWWLKPRLSYAEAYARAREEIERDYPIEQMRAESRMKALQDKIARDERRRRLLNGGEYEHGIEGLQ